MGHIIKMHDDPHVETQSMLPWYANGTLDPAEIALVETHLAECAECRAALEAERALARQFATMSIDVEQSWAGMSAQLAATRARRAAPIRFLRRPVAIGWAIAAQAIAAALILVLVLPDRGPSVTPGYHALGSAPVAGAGNVIILFGPGVMERDMRSALVRADARVVDGPTASGAYIVRVAAGKRPDALKQLRTTSGIALAEPIDGPSQP